MVSVLVETCTRFITYLILKGMDTISGEATRKLFYVSILKRDPFLKERICHQGEQLFSINPSHAEYDMLCRRGGSNEYHTLCFEQKYENNNV